MEYSVSANNKIFPWNEFWFIKKLKLLANLCYYNLYSIKLLSHIINCIKLHICKQTLLILSENKSLIKTQKSYRIISDFLVVCGRSKQEHQLEVV